VNIFTELLKINPDAKLFFIGEGPLKPDIEKQIKELKLNDKVVLLGAKKNVNELLSAFDVFLLPSLSEGLPVSIVEAQASGLPCVFSEAVPPEVCLIPSLFRPISLEESNETWAKLILAAKPLEHREEAYALVEKAGFDIKSTAKSLEEFYLKIVGGNLN
jgi:glycosyltransferase involved in cell wall biosynthesis